MSQTMRQVKIDDLNRVVIVDSPIPEPASGEARVAVTYVGICGTDTHAIVGAHPLLIPPYLPGHEITGVVEAVGSPADEVLVGQRVIVQPNVHCGDCVNCQEYRSNACQDLRWIGCDPSGALPGGMAKYVTAPIRNLHTLPESVTELDAVLVECLATPVHAARIAGDLTGLRVAVLGVGTIGLLSVIAAKRAGAETVAVTDPVPAKRERAVRFGATVAVDSTSQSLAEEVEQGLGGLADVVFDCVATESSIRQAVQIMRRAGTLLLVGVPPREAVVPLPYVQDWELRVQGCANYTAADVETAIAIAASGDLPGRDIITGVYPLAESSSAFAEAALGSAGKVVIRPDLN